jgi:hypothetical protein
MEGLSGIKIYNQINVDTRFLPSDYLDSLKFIIKGVNHSIKDGKWETSLETIVIAHNETDTPVTPITPLPAAPSPLNYQPPSNILPNNAFVVNGQLVYNGIDNTRVEILPPPSNLPPIPGVNPP